MEQILDFLGVVGRVVLAAVFALMPARLVWLSVVIAAILARRLRHRIAAQEPEQHQACSLTR